MGKIIAVANQKGGVGKTTTAVNVAAYLADAKKKTLIIDSDPQGNASVAVGINRDDLKYCFYDALINDVPLSALIKDTPVPNLQVVPATIQLAGAEIELASGVNKERKLKTQLEKIKDNFDYIVIDCPPTLGLLTINALTGADSLLVPIQCEYFALEGLSQLMSTYQIVKKHTNPNLEIEGVVLTMHDGRTNLSNDVAGEVTAHFKSKVFKTVIPRNIRLSEAPSFGQPINLYDPRSKGAKAYKNLVKEILKNN